MRRLNEECKSTDLTLHKKRNNLMKKIKIYMSYFKIRFLNEIQYRTAAIAGVATQFAWGALYIMLYTAFLKDGTASSYTISQMSTYIWLHQGFFSLFNLWSLDTDTLEQCRTGDVAMELVKPVGLYSIWHAKTLGKKVAMAFLRIIPILIICSLPFLGEFRLMAPVSPVALIMSIITLILSIGIMMSYVLVMLVLIMMVTAEQGIRTVFYLVLEFCSGALIPIPFMPESVIQILKFTPFYYMENVSYNIYNGYISGSQEIISIVLLQIFWLVALTVIGKVMLNKQLNKIVVQGG